MKWSAQTRDAIIEAIRGGLKRARAAQVAGIGERTLYEWLQKGRDGVEPYVELTDAIERAEAEFIRGGLELIAQHAAKDWRAMAWLLERMHPAEFSLNVEMRTSVNVTVDRTLPERLAEAGEVTEDDLVDHLESLEQRGG